MPLGAYFLIMLCMHTDRLGDVADRGGRRRHAHAQPVWIFNYKGPGHACLAHVLIRDLARVEALEGIFLELLGSQHLFPNILIGRLAVVQIGIVELAAFTCRLSRFGFVYRNVKLQSLDSAVLQVEGPWTGTH